MEFSRSRRTCIAIGASIAAIMIFSACGGPSGPQKIYTIELPTPTDAERGSVGQGGKGAPYQVGFGRTIPQGKQRIALEKLDWREIDDVYHATIVVKSTAAKAIRVGLHFYKDVPTLQVAFRGTFVKLNPAEIIRKSNSGLFWGPVVDSDTVTIDLTATTLPTQGYTLDIPTLSHIP